MDPTETATSNFWQNHGEMNDVDPSNYSALQYFVYQQCVLVEEDNTIVQVVGCNGIIKLLNHHEAKPCGYFSQKFSSSHVRTRPKYSGDVLESF